MLCYYMRIPDQGARLREVLPEAEAGTLVGGVLRLLRTSGVPQVVAWAAALERSCSALRSFLPPGWPHEATPTAVTRAGAVK
jgi:hypothetical protein